MMAREERAMRRVAVIGVGVTRFGKHDRTSGELFADAAVDALADAELPPGAVQALYYGNVVGGETETLGSLPSCVFIWRNPRSTSFAAAFSTCASGKPRISAPLA